jgi:hypothetical protein
MGLTGVIHNWTAAENALLGKLPDPEVARRIGLTPAVDFQAPHEAWNPGLQTADSQAV